MKTYQVIGLMSGTSLDGVDLAFCKFSIDYLKWSYKILASKTYAFTNSLQKEIQNLIATPHYYSDEFDIKLGLNFGEKINQFISEFEIDKTKIDCIASHGQTIYHNPKEMISIQAGDGQSIANTTNIKTICDFRRLDVSLGGQGAPLVPIGDLLLFQNFDYCLNLGGIANISFKQNGKIISAYDICSCNGILNFYTQKIDKKFDENGAIARSGTINKNLLEALNTVSFYKKESPKSLDAKMAIEEIAKLVNDFKIEIPDILNTLCHHISTQIANELNKESSQSTKVLITGGGANNTFLIELIKEKSNSEIVKATQNLIDFKEALIFAFMAVLKMRNEINCLKIVTGAKVDSCSGNTYLPKR